MQMPAKDEWMFEEPTVAEEERETAARHRMAAAIAEQVRAAVPGAAVLVVARGPGVPSGVFVAGHEPTTTELDGVVLAEILAGANDDRVALALTRLVLGDGGVVEHTVARDRDGTVMGVIAARPTGRVSQTWLRNVLARAGAGLAGWLAYAMQWPPQTLLEAVTEPALAQENGIVLVANTALARMLGRELGEVIGMPVSRITQRFPVLRSCSLVVGGRARSALLFECRRSPAIEASMLAALDRVLAERYAFLRHVTRVSVDGRDGAAVVASAAAVEELVSLALLDMAAVFTSASPTNHLRIHVFRDAGSLVLELVATGALAQAPDLEHLGAVLCAARTRSLGGQFLLDGSRADSRVMRIALPVAS